MDKKYKFAFWIPISLTLVLGTVFAIMFTGVNAVLEPKGWVASQEKWLLLFSTGMMLIVVIPVFVLTFVVAWRFRAENDKSKYEPEWDNSHLLEGIWWGVPLLIILVLSIIGWRDTMRLDPYKPLESPHKAINIQVVALQYKWLFIYPDEGIATVGFFQFPEKVPLHLVLTADAPMNSFWLPELSGQIFAMPGMRTELFIIADKEGEFTGSSANISGEGFAKMTFVGKATSEEEYQTWLGEVKKSGKSLTLEEYKKIADPEMDIKTMSLVLKEKDLFQGIIMKYMHPEHE